MGLPKGVTNNLKGRKIGSKNKHSLYFPVFFEYIFTGGIDRFKQELNSLTGVEYITTFILITEKINNDSGFVKKNEVLLDIFEKFIQQKLKTKQNETSKH